MQCLLFEIDGADFALPTGQVEEVVPYVRSSPLPDAPTWVRGVIDHRGHLLPLVDLPRLVGAGEIEPIAGTRIVIIDVRLSRDGHDDDTRRRIAVLVGAVHEVIELDPSVPEGFDGLPGGSMPHLGRLVPWSGPDDDRPRSIRLVEADRILDHSHLGVLFGPTSESGAA